MANKKLSTAFPEPKERGAVPELPGRTYLLCHRWVPCWSVLLCAQSLVLPQRCQGRSCPECVGSRSKTGAYSTHVRLHKTPLHPQQTNMRKERILHWTAVLCWVVSVRKRQLNREEQAHSKMWLQLKRGVVGQSSCIPQSSRCWNYHAYPSGRNWECERPLHIGGREVS